MNGEVVYIHLNPLTFQNTKHDVRFLTFKYMYLGNDRKTRFLDDAVILYII